MVWRAGDPQGNEAGKVHWDIVPYTRGVGLDIGCGKHKAFAHFTGVDQIPGVDMVVKDCVDLSIYASGVMDFVFSSHALEHVEDTAKCLAEWWRVIRPGGHLVLYLPHKHYYPNVGDRGAVTRWLIDHAEPTEPIASAVDRLVKLRKERGIKSIGALYAGTVFANPDHKHDFLPNDIVEIMRTAAPGWDLIENEERSEDREYSFFQVYRKRADEACVLNSTPWKKPGSKKVCVVRYGGFGDLIQASTVLPALKDEGWHVTLMTTPRGHDILKHDPHIDEFFVQDNDQVPNGALPDYWNCWRKKFDRFINFSESVEGSLLAMPGRAAFHWPDEMRRKYLGVNYLEFMHEIAGVPGPARQMFYPSKDELDWARKELPPRGFRIMWALSGSSVHKAYPHQDMVMHGVLRAIPDACFVLVGDEACKLIEDGFEKSPRIVLTSGRWSVRQTLAAAQECEVVVGPETGVLNSVGLVHNTKIVLLSHSSPENLPRDWLNTDVIVPDVPCHPCHRMHQNRDHCPEWVVPVEESRLRGNEKALQEMTALGHVVNGMFHTGAAICAASIAPQLIIERIKYHYDAWRTHQIVPAAG